MRKMDEKSISEQVDAYRKQIAALSQGRLYEEWNTIRLILNPNAKRHFMTHESTLKRG